MNKFLKRILLFLPFAILMYLVFLTIWGGFCPQFLRKNMLGPQGFYYTYERLQEAKTTTDIDILFLGSSRTYRGFDTRVFEKAGFKTFNLGTSSQTYLQTEVLLKRYLPQMNPKLVVIELSFGAFILDGMESALDIVANDAHHKHAWQMVTQYNDISLYNTWLYAGIWSFLRKNRLNWRIETFQKKLYAQMKGTDTYVSGGYVEKELMYFKKNRQGKFALHFNEEMFDAFERCLDICRQNGVDVILVQAPYTQGFYRSVANRNDFDSKIDSYNIPHYNFNNIMPLNDSLCFYDAFHLNQIGAKVFSARFAYTIDTLGILK